MSENATAGQSAGDASLDARNLLSIEERAKMISRIHSLVYWVGMLIPERALLDGSEIDLREVVYNLTTKEKLTVEDVQEANDLIAHLKVRERELETQLSHDQMTRDAAKGILEEICGLLRAIDELRSAESVEKAEFKKEALMSRVEDAKRWQKFVESIKPTKRI
jgi:Family of unknown function (DUF5788)